MTKKTLKIEHADYLFTLDGERRIIQDGSLLVEGQRILRVGPAAELDGVTADRVIDARGKVVTPGFVNTHDHLYPQIMRGMLLDEIGPSYVEDFCSVRDLISEDEEYLGVLSCLTEHLKYGTTTVLNPGDSARLDPAFQAYEETGARIIMGRNITDVPNKVQTRTVSTSEALAELEQTLKHYNGRCDGRVTAWVMLTYATTACSEVLAIASKRLADSHGVGMTFHQSARQIHVDECLRLHGLRPIEYLEKLGVVGPNVLLGHALRVSDREIEIMARTQTRASACPGTSLRCGYGTTAIGRLPEMLAQGVVVGLGTDSSDFGVAEMMRQMYLAATLYKDAREDTGLVPAEKALEMATIDGAKALGLDQEIGSLEPGKKADIVVFNARRPEWRPIHNPVNNLVYNADGRSVETVIVDGSIRIEHGRPTFIDEAVLSDRVQAGADALVARAGFTVPSRWPIVRPVRSMRAT